MNTSNIHATADHPNPVVECTPDLYARIHTDKLGSAVRECTRHWNPIHEWHGLEEIEEREVPGPHAQTGRKDAHKLFMMI